MRPIVLLSLGLGFCLFLSSPVFARDQKTLDEGTSVQVPLAGEVKPEKIPREIFYEKGKRILTEDMLLIAGYLAQYDHPFGYIKDFQEVKDAAAPGDVIFIDRGEKNGVKIGQRYYIYQRGVDVKDPYSDEEWGYIINIIGLVEISEVSKEAASAKVVKAYGLIFKGDGVLPEFGLIGPKLDPDRPVEDKNINATIMAAHFGKGGVSGDDIVYLNVGRVNRVEEGDMFKITEVHKEDGELKSGKFGIEKKIGKLRIIIVREETATAIITESLSEIKVGDKASFIQER